MAGLVTIAVGGALGAAESLRNLALRGPSLATLQRRTIVTSTDKALRDMMESTGENYNIFMGTLDAMNDNLIAEAISRGIGVEKIVQAMFACEESRISFRKSV
jgi:hypothetical protein